MPIGFTRNMRFNWKRFFKSKNVVPIETNPTEMRQGVEGILLMGHREYVGGMWEKLGSLQFGFLLEQGLRKDHVLLDIACGSLRLGVKAIPYLEPGHYLGIEKERMLLEKGVSEELGEVVMAAQRPRLLCNSDFDFDQFGTPVDMAIAQSLFTHMPSDLICRCLSRLKPWMKPESRFYATFFESESVVTNPAEADDHGYFAYTRAQMEEFGIRQGYSMHYLGAWNHPRGQMMVEYRLHEGSS